MKKWLVAVLILIACLLPVIPQDETITTQSIEPYEVSYEVGIPYRAVNETSRWVESEAYWKWKHNIKSSVEDALPEYYGLGQIQSGRWVADYIYTTRYRTETQYRTEYRVVEKKHIVRRTVSLLEWLSE